MAAEHPKPRHFRAIATLKAVGGATIPVPFDPAGAWGQRDRYHVTGTINGARYRGALERSDRGWQIGLGRKSPGAVGLADGQAVVVEIWPEGPQRDELARDVSAALAKHPKAEAAFEGLATFYRKGWLRWIDATKRRPEVRAQRIAEMVRLLEAGRKER